MGYFHTPKTATLDFDDPKKREGTDPVSSNNDIVPKRQGSGKVDKNDKGGI